PSLHEGAARCAAAPGGDRPAARCDRGRTAEPGADPERLRVPSALPVRGRAEPRRGAAARRDRRRPAARMSQRSLPARMSALELRDVEVTYERRGRENVRAVAGASLT